MSNLVYHIKDLACQYSASSEPVLQIEELNLYKGEIVFFVGASGVGKSTLLETLGLMNNTIDFQKSGEFWFVNKNKREDLRGIWSRSEKDLSKFRQENLSFIFQSTNLFPNLSAFENVLLTQIVEGKSYDEAAQNAKSMIYRLFPNQRDRDEIVEDGKAIMELSGGQRQRLAFVRAAISKYSILLADEPTGNLDSKTGLEIMALFDEIHAAGNTVIMVTHEEEIAAHAKRVIRLRDGVIESDTFNS